MSNMSSMSRQQAQFYKQIDRHISVAVRFRPESQQEEHDNDSTGWTINKAISNSVSHAKLKKPFIFDRVFGPSASTEQVWEDMARDIVECCVDGINGTIFAYGQTASGKTFTMHGDQLTHGIIPQSVLEIFNLIEKRQEKFYLTMNYMEVYNERIIDLLGSSTDIRLLENTNGIPELRDITFHDVQVPCDIFSALTRGEQKRHVGATMMNERSSRSHTILRINIESTLEPTTQSFDPDTPFDFVVRQSQLNLVDLAGSEGLRNNNALRARKKRECTHINQSLLALSQVIRTLSMKKRGKDVWVGYRDSKLTRILESSLGGNSQTAIICACAISPQHYTETKSTLDFAIRAKTIVTHAYINIPHDKNSAMAKMHAEIQLLRKSLAECVEKSEALKIDLENERHRRVVVEVEVDMLFRTKMETESEVSELVRTRMEAESVVEELARTKSMMEQDMQKFCDALEEKLRAQGTEVLERESAAAALQSEVTRLIAEHEEAIQFLEQDFLNKEVGLRQSLQEQADAFNEQQHMLVKERELTQQQAMELDIKFRDLMVISEKCEQLKIDLDLERDRRLVAEGEVADLVRTKQILEDDMLKFCDALEESKLRARENQAVLKAYLDQQNASAAEI